MRAELTYFLLICFAVFSGCATVPKTPKPASYYEKAAFAQETELASLFSSDSTILSDADIKHILEYRYSPQNQNRIGIITIAQNSLFGWSDEIHKSGVEVQSKLVSKLLSSFMVFDAAYLPGLLIPEKKTVGHFREAGARYQADLLLIYRVSFRTYEKYKFLSPQKINSYCTVEAVLLDIRTGIVPFSMVGTRDFLTEQSDQDYNNKDTMHRSELAALGFVLEEVGEQVVSFLGSTNR